MHSNSLLYEKAAPLWKHLTLLWEKIILTVYYEIKIVYYGSFLAIKN